MKKRLIYSFIFIFIIIGLHISSIFFFNYMKKQPTYQVYVQNMEVSDTEKSNSNTFFEWNAVNLFLIIAPSIIGFPIYFFMKRRKNKSLKIQLSKSQMQDLHLLLLNSKVGDSEKQKNLEEQIELLFHSQLPHFYDCLEESLETRARLTKKEIHKIKKVKFLNFESFFQKYAFVFFRQGFMMGKTQFLHELSLYKQFDQENELSIQNYKEDLSMYFSSVEIIESYLLASKTVFESGFERGQLLGRDIRRGRSAK